MKGQQTRGVEIAAITNRYEGKCMLIDGIICSIVGLFLLVTAVAVPSVNASNNNCVHRLS